MNSMPAASSVVLTFSRVPLREGGIPSAASKRCTVRQVTPDRRARSSALMPSKARAALIWSEEIIDL